MYLPQFHPIPENDEWWGKGFTEWTNVAKAKPLFSGHFQPNLPGELGFYDLRVPEVREQQAALARKYGIEGFMYWHYWFAGKRILERPFKEVLESGKPDFPFCLGWANESWQGNWHGLSAKKMLIEQTYPGGKDYEQHFYSILPAFKDKRYITVDDKPLFVVYHPAYIPNCRNFVEEWQELAMQNGLKGIYFVGIVLKIDEHKEAINLGFDATHSSGLGAPIELLYKQKNINTLIYNIKRRLMLYGLNWKYTSKGVFKYEDFIKYHLEYQQQSISKNIENQENIFPEIFPKWDNSPRAGYNSLIIKDATPEKFRTHVKEIFNLVKNKPVEKKIVFIKSWNEWAEGNYMEPDQKFGRKWLEVFKEEVELFNKNKKI
jgi:hypothetical protein